MSYKEQYKVMITELGEVLGHDDLDYILDIIVEDYKVPVSSLLDSVCIIEYCHGGHSGCTLPISKQIELIQNYINKKG